MIKAVGIIINFIILSSDWNLSEKAVSKVLIALQYVESTTTLKFVDTVPKQLGQGRKLPVYFAFRILKKVYIERQITEICHTLQVRFWICMALVLKSIFIFCCIFEISCPSGVR